MENVMTNGFAELSAFESASINGGIDIYIPLVAGVVGIKGNYSSKALEEAAAWAAGGAIAGCTGGAAGAVMGAMGNFAASSYCSTRSGEVSWKFSVLGF